jgi:hypothetical protein
VTLSHAVPIERIKSITGNDEVSVTRGLPGVKMKPEAAAALR